MDSKFSKKFIDTIVYGWKFNFEEFESAEELKIYYNEIEGFNLNPEHEKYKELFLLVKKEREMHK
ncbi:hypothetical protein [Niallia taxi]|uniref:hypothetical protein n=1 Tax=Niallia taxi TaxID=2499688 RepID=UPI0015F4BB88|nr:hypothetical protein [Niallia taxi]